MRTGARVETLAEMSDPQTRITLDLHLSGKPVEGHVAAAGEEPRWFSGYAGLIAALESIRTTNGRRHDKESDRARGSA